MVRLPLKVQLETQNTSLLSEAKGPQILDVIYATVSLGPPSIRHDEAIGPAG
jgi:hypothetical protein